MNKANDLTISSYIKFIVLKERWKKSLTINNKGVSTLVEVAGILAIIVACIIIVLPQAQNAIKGIWNTVTNNAKSFFNSNTIG